MTEFDNSPVFLFLSLCNTLIHLISRTGLKIWCDVIPLDRGEGMDQTQARRRPHRSCTRRATPSYWSERTYLAEEIRKLNCGVVSTG